MATSMYGQWTTSVHTGQSTSRLSTTKHSRHTTRLLPTIHVSTCRRWRKSKKVNKKGRHKQLSCPQTLSTYMSYMRGVDIYSQRESYARIGRKTARWWPHLAWFMIDMAINNAYVLYNLRTGRKLTPTQFREQLMVALVGDFTQRKKRGRPEKVRIRADEVHHIPMTLSVPEPCMVCARKGKKKSGEHKPRTREGCETCWSACHFGCWKQHLPIESKEDE